MLIEDAIKPLVGRVTGCPELEIIRAYRFGLIEFCAKTNVMTSWVTTNTEDLKTPSLSMDQQVIDILDATLDGEDLNIVPMNSREVLTASAEAPVLTWQNPNVPMILPDPVEPLEVQLLMSYAPGPDSLQVEDTIYLRYQEALEEGAMWRLLKDSKRPWADPAQAAIHKGVFDQAAKEAASFVRRNIRTLATRLRTKKGPL